MQQWDRFLPSERWSLSRGRASSFGAEAEAPASVLTFSFDACASTSIVSSLRSVALDDCDPGAEVRLEVAEAACDEAPSCDSDFFASFSFSALLRAASRSWMTTLSMRRKNCWSDILLVRRLMDGSCNSRPRRFGFLGALTTTADCVYLQKSIQDKTMQSMRFQGWLQ